uniref:uncharacterized protein LOC114583248 n=1 Tax=Podarcis muralis TaxID=64176 RepID=UPI0010A000A9|nr:uncharacterized protein LOC114583248 [Podarcis muralis]
MAKKLAFSRNPSSRFILLNTEIEESQSAALLLVGTLLNFRDGDREKFKGELLSFPFKEGVRRIPKRLLKEADAWQLSDLLMGYYGEAYAVEVTALVLQAMDYNPPADHPLAVSCLMQLTQLCLLATLNTLKESDLKKFMVKLSKFPVKEGYVSIPRKLLQKANVWEVTELLLAYCDEDYAVEVASEVLKAFDREPLPECPPSFTREAAERLCEMYVSRHRPAEFLSSKINQALEELVPSEKATKGVRSTEAGSFRCGDTDLICDVTEAVTVTYHFDSWPKHLEEQSTEELHVAGPLLNIKVDVVEAVAAIHVPHFLCLEGDDSSHVYITHFVEGGMRLEKPDRVEPHHAVLENPKFSSLGVVFKKWFKQKINTVVLLYQRLRLETPTFHLYLLPNDPSIVKAVEKREVNSKRIEKPPVTLKPLMIGSQVSLKASEDVTVYPKELEFQYLDAEKLQQYLELSAEQMQDKFNFYLMKKGTTEIVWEAHLKKKELISGELDSPILHPAQGACGCTPSNASFSRTNPGHSAEGR